MSFTIITDSCANLTSKQISDYGLKIVPLTYTVGDTEYLGYTPGVEPDYKSFYSLMREKEHVKTSLVSYDRVEEMLNNVLGSGEDVLYITFSSALSGTYQVVKNCIEDIAPSYPDRKVMLVDSLCASMGQGLFVKYAAEKRNEGLSLEETAKWLEENKLNFVHLFTVDDLFFLKRGGRLSGTVAIVGTLLNIKPLLHVDNEGKLVSTGKARGRKASINELIAKMGENGENLNEQEIFISHADCLEDAEYAANRIKELYGVKNVVINYIDPVIGSHSGPGTLAIFYLGTER